MTDPIREAFVLDVLEQESDTSNEMLAKLRDGLELESATQMRFDAFSAGWHAGRADLLAEQAKATSPSHPFSGAIGDMARKDQRDPMKVLAVLHRSPRFSVFDATESLGIANSLVRLARDGYIEYPQPQPGYPWSLCQLTAKGLATAQP